MKLGGSVRLELADLEYHALYRKTLWIVMHDHISLWVYNQVEVGTWDSIVDEVCIIGEISIYENR